MSPPEKKKRVARRKPKLKTFEHGFVEVRGARQHNLRGIDLDIPRNAFVAFTGVSGSGKSSLAFGTIFAEAQRRYFESIAPYARRLMAQLPAPKVGDIRGLPPAVALQQRRGEPTARSSVGTLTRLSNSLRMLYSRAGTYPQSFIGRLDSDAFSPNTVSGACTACHGIGIVHTVTESSLVPNPELSIRERAVAAWPGAWQGKNYIDILNVLGYDVDKPWKDLPQKDRDWILFTEEKPVVTVHAIREAHRIQRPYQGTYQSAAVYVRHTFGTTGSATLRKRVAQYMEASPCGVCGGKRLQQAALSVTFGGRDIAELSHMPFRQMAQVLGQAGELKDSEVARLIVDDLLDRIGLLSRLGLDYLALDRSTPSLSAGELQRLRLTTQLKSGLFGVVYVLDEPSAGLHPADAEALLDMLLKLRDVGNSLFVVEHEMDLVRRADWLVDIGPQAGEGGGSLIYSGPVAGLEGNKKSITAPFLFASDSGGDTHAARPAAKDWLKLSGVTRHNLYDLTVKFPIGRLTAVTGVSGSGKSTLVTQVLTDTVRETLGAKLEESEDGDEPENNSPLNEVNEATPDEAATVASIEGLNAIKRLVSVDQRPIGRTPRSNLATYTGLFDHVRKAFAATPDAKKHGYNAGRFSFNVNGGRCAVCEGEGFVSVELMFLPSVYTPCGTCHGARYNPETLQVLYREKNIAQVLDMTVDSAAEFFTEIPAVVRALASLKQVGLGYLRLGQPATELSGGEAQRIRLATELQREQRGDTLYLLDEPSTGLHPADVKKLMLQLHSLVDAGNTVIVVEHDMDIVSAADWVIDLGPGAGADGGKVVADGTPQKVASSKTSRTAPYLAARIKAAK
ncbi:MAG: excinuclease ABC subunit UvrA [Cyanobacteria bacterium SZAS TMP-1]|nr:excinuclease ABC subunit UvrA [Cyanobacteria bacterium SZAS TMP-1]